MKKYLTFGLALACLSTCFIVISSASAAPKCTSSQRFSIQSQQSVVNSWLRNLNSANTNLQRANSAVNQAQTKVNDKNSQITRLNSWIITAQQNANRNVNFPSIQRTYLNQIADYTGQIQNIQRFLSMDQSALNSALSQQASALRSVSSAQNTYDSQLQRLRQLQNACN